MTDQQKKAIERLHMFGTHGKFGYIPDPPEIDCEGEVLEDFDMEDCRRCGNYDECLKEYRAYMEGEGQE